MRRKRLIEGSNSQDNLRFNYCQKSRTKYLDNDRRAADYSGSQLIKRLAEQPDITRMRKYQLNKNYF